MGKYNYISVIITVIKILYHYCIDLDKCFPNQTLNISIGDESGPIVYYSECKVSNDDMYQVVISVTYIIDNITNDTDDSSCWNKTDPYIGLLLTRKEPPHANVVAYIDKNVVKTTEKIAINCVIENRMSLTSLETQKWEISCKHNDSYSYIYIYI